MEIVDRKVRNTVIVNVNNRVELGALFKLLELSGVDNLEDINLLNLFGIGVDSLDYFDFKLSYADLELIKNLNITEFKVLRECGKLKKRNYTLNNDVEVFLLNFTVNEFKFVRGLLREINYFDEVEFFNNRVEKECSCNEDDMDLAS